MRIVPAVVIAAFLSAVSSVSAVDFVIQSESNDRALLANGTAVNATQETIRIGNSNNNMSAAYFGFLLPVLQSNEIITGVDFSVGLTGRSNNPAGSIDLHGLGVFASSAPTPIGGFYNGQLPEDDPFATMLVDDFMTSASLTGTANSTADVGGASATLLDYLNDFYTAGAPQDAYLMLRLVIDADTLPNSRYYTVGSANNTVESLRPYLTITTVPEPATTAGFIGVAALGLAVVCRRFRAKKQ